MNKSQENKLSMYILVNSICDEHNKAWTSFGAFADSKKEFENIIRQINQARQVQEINKTGVTINRKQIRANLTEMTMKYIAALKLYAHKNDDMILLKEVSYTKTDLIESRDTIFADICRLIFNSARKHMEQLSYFGPTQEMTEQYRKTLSLYVNNLSGTKKERNRKVLSTRSLAELFVEGDEVLRLGLDAMILFLKDDNPIFYDNYIKSRKIHAAGTRHNLPGNTNEMNHAA